MYSVLLRQLLPGEDVKLRFSGIRQSEEDRTLSAIIPELSEITADLIAHNLLVLLRVTTSVRNDAVLLFFLFSSLSSMLQVASLLQLDLSPATKSEVCKRNSNTLCMVSPEMGQVQHSTSSSTQT